MKYLILALIMTSACAAKKPKEQPFLTLHTQQDFQDLKTGILQECAPSVPMPNVYACREALRVMPNLCERECPSQANPPRRSLRR